MYLSSVEYAVGFGHSQPSCRRTLTLSYARPPLTPWMVIVENPFSGCGVYTYYN
jgi:hypothetical protein